MADEVVADLQQDPAADVTPEADVTEQKDPSSELETLRAALKKANAESAERRKRLDALERQEAEKKTAGLSEVEKANAALKEHQEKVAALEAENLGYKREKAFAKAVAGMGSKFVNDIAREDALAYLPADLDLTDETAVKAALNEIKKNRPHLFAAPQPAPSNDGDKRGPAKPGTLTPERKAAISNMLPSRLRN